MATHKGGKNHTIIRSGRNKASKKYEKQRFRTEMNKLKRAKKRERKAVESKRNRNIVTE